MYLLLYMSKFWWILWVLAYLLIYFRSFLCLIIRGIVVCTPVLMRTFCTLYLVFNVSAITPWNWYVDDCQTSICHHNYDLWNTYYNFHEHYNNSLEFLNYVPLQLGDLTSNVCNTLINVLKIGFPVAHWTVYLEGKIKTRTDRFFHWHSLMKLAKKNWEENWLFTLIC